MKLLKDDKLNEVIGYYVLNGEQKTLDDLGMKQDSLRRYIAEYEKRTGNKKLVNISHILENFTDDELKLMASNKRLPIRKTSKLDFSGDFYTFGVLSDLHIGSKYTEPQEIAQAIDILQNEGVDAIYFPGDVIEGMSTRMGHVYELSQDGIGIKAQKKLAIETLSGVKCKAYMIEGNHCAWSKQQVGYSPIEDIADSMHECEYLGEHEGDVFINGVSVRLWHGLDGASYAISYRPQKIINALAGGDKPNIMLLGHDHKQMYLIYRNIHSFSCGTMQRQSQWMRMKGLQASPGFWRVKACIGDNQVKWTESRFYTIYGGL